MKTTFLCKFALYFFILSAAFFKAQGAEPVIPSNLWQQPIDGVSVAIVLEDEGQKSSIVVYFKNTSASPQYLPGDDNVAAVQIFYADRMGNFIPLQDYLHKEPRSRAKPARPDLRVYEAGEVGSRKIDLNPAQLKLIEDALVMCKFNRAYEGGKTVPVQTVPAKLVKVPTSAS